MLFLWPSAAMLYSVFFTFLLLPFMELMSSSSITMMNPVLTEDFHDIFKPSRQVPGVT